MAERHVPGRDDLQAPEEPGHRLAFRVPEDPVDREHQQERPDEPDDR